MSLTSSQITTLRALIDADPVLSSFPMNADGHVAVAQALNQPASPTFYVYRTDIPVQEVFDQVQWSKLTPADAIPTDTALNAAIWQSRSLACQGKQFNLQTLLMGQATINGAKANVRAGLQDALTNVPSAASGATQAAGWVGVRDSVLARAATVAEKALATGNGGTAATAATMTFEGALTAQDVEAVRQA